MVLSWMPRLVASAAQRLEVKTVPLSEVMMSGRPNLVIQPLRRARRQSSVVEPYIGTTSGYLAALLMAVKRYLKPPEEGRGPTMSTWMWPNLLVGGSKLPMPDSVCRDTLLDWQGTHALAQFLASLLMESHTKRWRRSLAVVLRDG